MIAASVSNGGNLFLAMLLLAKIIPNADAVWYSEVCPTHMRYKVRIDPSTGKIVQVMHPGFTTDMDDQPYASNSEDETTSESHSIAHNHIATNEDQSIRVGGDAPTRVPEGLQVHRKFVCV